jgi:hypothetical protein
MTCGPWITATILATLFTYGVSTWAMSSFLLDYINNRTNGPRLSSTVTFVEVVPRARSASYNVKRTLCIIMTRQLLHPPAKKHADIRSHRATKAKLLVPGLIYRVSTVTPL